MANSRLVTEEAPHLSCVRYGCLRDAGLALVNRVGRLYLDVGRLAGGSQS